MIVICTTCQAKFRVADEKIGPRGAKVRCSKCQTIFAVHPDLGSMPLPGQGREAGPAAQRAPGGLELEARGAGPRHPPARALAPAAAPARNVVRAPDGAPARSDAQGLAEPTLPPAMPPPLPPPPPWPARPPPLDDPFAAAAAPPAPAHPGDPDPFARAPQPAPSTLPVTDLSDLLGPAPERPAPRFPEASGWDEPGPDPFRHVPLATAGGGEGLALEAPGATPAPAALAEPSPPGSGGELGLALEDRPAPSHPQDVAWPGDEPAGGPAFAAALEVPGAVSADPFAAAQRQPGLDAGPFDFGAAMPVAESAAAALVEPGFATPAGFAEPGLAAPDGAPPGFPEPGFAASGASAALADSGLAVDVPAPAAARPVAAPRPPQPEERIPGGRGSRLRAALVNAVALVALLAVAVWMLGVWRAGGPLEPGALRPAAVLASLRGEPASAGPFRAQDVHGGVYERERGAPLLFVRGTVVSRAPAPVRAVTVSAEIVRDGRVVARGDALAGALPTPEELYRAADAASLDEVLRAARARAPRRIGPGEAVPFLVAIGDAPAELEGSSVRVTVAPPGGRSP